MTISSDTAAPTHTSPFRAPITTIAVFAVLGTVGSAAYLASFFVYGFRDIPAVELFRSPLVLMAFWLMFIGLGGVGMLLPAVVGNRVTPWAVYVAAGSFIASAAMVFATGTVMAEITLFVTEAEFQALVDYPLVFVMGMVHGILGLVGFVSLAIIGRRRRLFGWGTTALFLAAALTSPLWHVPPAGLLASLAVLALARILRGDELA